MECDLSIMVAWPLVKQILKIFQISGWELIPAYVAPIRYSTRTRKNNNDRFSKFLDTIDNLNFTLNVLIFPHNNLSAVVGVTFFSTRLAFRHKISLSAESSERE